MTRDELKAAIRTEIMCVSRRAAENAQLMDAIMDLVDRYTEDEIPRALYRSQVWRGVYDR